MSDEITSTETTDAIVAKPANPSCPMGKCVTMLACLLSIAALLVASFFGYQWHSQYRPLLARTAHWQDKTAQLADQFQQDQAHQSDLQQQLRAQQTQLSQLQHRLSQDKQSWVLARVGSLIKLASDQSVFMHDANGAIALLMAANQAVAKAQLPQWSALSESLHEDINALRSIPSVNVNETLGQLDALDRQLNQLPLNMPHFQPHTLIQTTDPNRPATITQAAFWKAHLAELWASLRKLLVIKHHDRSILPIVDSQQQAYLRQNVHLILFQAKWAVIYRDNALYHSSLLQLSRSIEDYFDQQSPITQTALANIKDLQALTLHATLPAPKASLSAWQALQTHDMPHSLLPVQAATPLHTTPREDSDAPPPLTHHAVIPQRADQPNAATSTSAKHNTVETINS